MIAARLQEHLDRSHVRYVTVPHSPAYTAQEVAASAHVSGHGLAKAVMVKLDGRLAMAVLPAARDVDLDDLRRATGAADVRLAAEAEFAPLFPGCEVGAVPPFGNLYGVDVFADETLADEEDITFNAGSHTDPVRMSYAD